MAYTDDGMCTWFYDADGYAGGASTYEEGYCEIDMCQTRLGQSQTLFFAPTPKNAMRINFRIDNSGVQQRVLVYTNSNETTDYHGGSVSVLDRYFYKASLQTQMWNKARFVVGNHLSGGDKYRWVRLEVFDSANGGTKQIEVAWTNTIANQYTEAGELGFGKSRSYSGLSGQIYMFDNFSVIPEPAAGLTLLLGALWRRNVKYAT